MKSLLFVDERRSPAAVRMDVRWQDGRVAAKQLSMSYGQLGSIQASAPFGVQNVFASKIPLRFRHNRPHASARRKLKLK
jgi:hypothetical protein